MDRFDSGGGRHGERPRRGIDSDLLGSPMTWFGLAVIGMVIVFVGLGVDAWRHNHGAEEETLLSLGNPGHLIAGIGLLVTALATLIGFSVSALHGVDDVSHAIRRFVPVTAAWAIVAAVGISSVTYIGATGVTVGHSHGDESTVAAGHTHDATGDDATGGDANVAGALKNEGIDVDGGGDPDPSTVPGALNGGQGANGEHVHDHGQQPTFAQWTSMSNDDLLPLFPEGTVSAEDMPRLREQIMQVQQVALKYPTVEAAQAAGYVNTTSDVPYMGMHYLNFDLVRKGVFDPEHPMGLLFSKVDSGAPKLVGVWFLILPGVGGNGVTREIQPQGFASDLDLWHAHVGLCLVGTSGASEGETRESCEAKGGNFTADLRWMMHVWVAPGFDNPAGAFAYLNADLYKQQAAAQGQQQAPSGTVPQ
jgi:hypothetical protein